MKKSQSQIFSELRAKNSPNLNEEWLATKHESVKPTLALLLK